MFSESLTLHKNPAYSDLTGSVRPYFFFNSFRKLESTFIKSELQTQILSAHILLSWSSAYNARGKTMLSAWTQRKGNTLVHLWRNNTL